MVLEFKHDPSQPLLWHGLLSVPPSLWRGRETAPQRGSREILPVHPEGNVSLPLCISPRSWGEIQRGVSGRRFRLGAG